MAHVLHHGIYCTTRQKTSNKSVPPKRGASAITFGHNAHATTCYPGTILGPFGTSASQPQLRNELSMVQPSAATRLGCIRSNRKQGLWQRAPITPQSSRMLVFLLTPNVDIRGEGESLDHPQAATLVQRAIVSPIRLGIHKHLFQNVIQFIERLKPLARTRTRAEQPQ